MIPGQKISKVYKSGEVVVEFRKTWNDDETTNRLSLRKEMTNIKDRLTKRKEEVEEKKKMMMTRRNENRKPLAEQFKGMEKNGTQFFYEGEKISEAKAIELVKENPKLNVSMHNSNGKGTVHLSKKGIKTVNGKLVQPKKAPKMAVNETKVTNLTVNADTLNELKAFDWKTLPSIFELNNPEEIITLSFNFDQKIKLGNSVVDSFNFTVSNKTSELHAMIKKSRKVISKLKAI